MAQKRKKRSREKGKIKLSTFFQNLEIGDHVALKQEKSVQHSFPIRFRGRVGVVKSKRGRVYIVTIKDGSKEKSLLVHPIHLVKIKS